MVSGIKQKCDFCNAKAVYDTQTKSTSWAFVCEKHFETYSTKQPGFYHTLAQHQVEATKACVICEANKELSEYYKYKDKQGVERYRNDCKACHLAERKRLSFRKDRGVHK